MPTRTRIGHHTFDDFLVLVRADQKAELLNGSIYIFPPQGIEENSLILRLAATLGVFVEECRIGTVTINKVVYRLSEIQALAPDVAFVRASRAGARRHNYVDGPPDLAIEVVSPESVDRDYVDKRLRYEESGVEEYWIIDPDESSALFLVREGNRFVEAQLSDSFFRSRVVPGFALDVRWLWQRPLPGTLAVVQSLLNTSR